MVDDESISYQKSSRDDGFQTIRQHINAITNNKAAYISGIISMNPITKIRSVLKAKANLAAQHNRLIEAVFFSSFFTVMALIFSISFVINFLLTTSFVGREYVLRLIIIAVPALSIVVALIFDYLNLKLTCKKT